MDMETTSLETEQALPALTLTTAETPKDKAMRVKLLDRTGVFLSMSTMNRPIAAQDVDCAHREFTTLPHRLTHAQLPASTSNRWPALGSMDAPLVIP